MIPARKIGSWFMIVVHEGASNSNHESSLSFKLKRQSFHCEGSGRIVLTRFRVDTMLRASTCVVSCFGRTETK